MVLEEEMREDDAESVASALGMVKGVGKVIMGDPTSRLDEIQAKMDLLQKFNEFYVELLHGK